MQTPVLPEYAWPFLVAAIASGALLTVAFRHRGVGIGRTFLPLAAAAFCWTLFAAITHVTPSPTAKIFWTHIRYVPISLIPVAWLVFAAAYTGHARRFRSSWSWTLLIVPAVTIAMVATHDRHSWMFVRTWIEMTGAIVSVGHEYGPWFWINLVYSYVLFAVGGLLILGHVLRSGALRGQGIAMVLGAVSPVLFNVAYVSAPDAFNQLDPTPIAFAVSTVFFGLARFRYKLFDILPAARALVFEHMTEGAAVLDYSGQVVDVNPAAAWLMQCDPGAVSGRPVEEAPEVLQAAWAGRNDFQARGESSIGPGSEKRWLEWTVSPLAIGRIAGKGIGRGWLVILRDTTAQREIEDRLREARDRAVELSQMKSTFLGNMNHEFRTPLAGIIGLSDILTSELNGEHSQMASMIKQGGDRLLGALDSVLSAVDLYSGTLSVQPETMEMSGLVRAIAERAESRIRDKGLELHVDVGTIPVFAEIDRGHFTQSIQNLIDNAVKYTEHGEITIRLDHSDRDVSVHVSDSGIGISAEFLPHVFEAFRQESDGMAREFEGMGMGLQVARGLVELMGGRVSAASSPGQGSQFSVTFNRVDPITATRGHASERSRMPSRAPVRRSIVGRRGSDRRAPGLVRRDRPSLPGTP